MIGKFVTRRSRVKICRYTFVNVQSNNNNMKIFVFYVGAIMVSFNRKDFI